jgi:hypothetical protein
MVTLAIRDEMPDLGNCLKLGTAETGSTLQLALDPERTRVLLAWKTISGMKFGIPGPSRDLDTQKRKEC